MKKKIFLQEKFLKKKKNYSNFSVWEKLIIKITSHPLVFLKLNLYKESSSRAFFLKLIHINHYYGIKALKPKIIWKKALNACGPSVKI